MPASSSPVAAASADPGAVRMCVFLPSVSHVPSSASAETGAGTIAQGGTRYRQQPAVAWSATRPSVRRNSDLQEVGDRVRWTTP